MRKIIIEYYNEAYHIQFWSNGTLVMHINSVNISERLLENFLTKGITDGQTISK